MFTIKTRQKIITILYIIFGVAAIIMITFALMNRINFNILLTTLGFMPLLTGIRHLALERFNAKTEVRRETAKNIGIIYIIIGLLIIIAPIIMMLIK